MTDHERGIEAAVAAYYARERSPIANDDIRSGVEAAISAYLSATKPVAEAVKVQPLLWELCEDGETYHAQSILGRWAYWEDHYLPPDGHGGRTAADPKAAAQADYEQRIMSALSTPTQPEAQGDNLLRIRDEAAFLLDRLSELEWSDIPDDFWRDWNGHVEPSIARLRAALPSKIEGGEDAR